MHKVAARLGYERAMVGPGWATSHPDCRHRRYYFHLVEVIFAKEECLGSEWVYGNR